MPQHPRLKGSPRSITMHECAMAAITHTDIRRSKAIMRERGALGRVTVTEATATIPAVVAAVCSFVCVLCVCV
jgi:hypothetical protein